MQIVVSRCVCYWCYKSCENSYQYYKSRTCNEIEVS